MESFGDIAGDSEDTILVKVLGPQSKISFEWELVEEATSVVSGAGGSVTTPVGQMKYLHDTLASTGADQILDNYTLTFDFGGGVTLVRTGGIIKIGTSMTENEPVTFKARIEFQVGTIT